MASHIPSQRGDKVRKRPPKTSGVDITHDYYADLDLTPEASQVDIRRQYRELVLKKHPDKYPQGRPEVLEAWNAINKAYEILADPAAKHWYDRRRPNLSKKGRASVVNSSVEPNDRHYAVIEQYTYASPPLPYPFQHNGRKLGTTSAATHGTGTTGEQANSTKSLSRPQFLRGKLKGADHLDKVGLDHAMTDQPRRSEKNVSSEQEDDPPVSPGTAVSGAGGHHSDRKSSLLASRSQEEYDDAYLEDEDVEPEEVLDTLIAEYLGAANSARERDELDQTEFYAKKAIGLLEQRERVYKRPFTDRAQLQEQLAKDYQAQHRHTDAMHLMHQLLRESYDGLSEARQHYILASIYFDHYEVASEPSSIESAERCAKQAFLYWFYILQTKDVRLTQRRSYRSCLVLLIRILRAQDKIVEAQAYALSLSSNGASLDEEYMTQESASRRTIDHPVAVDKAQHVSHPPQTSSQHASQMAPGFNEHDQPSDIDEVSDSEIDTLSSQTALLNESATNARVTGSIDLPSDASGLSDAQRPPRDGDIKPLDGDSLATAKTTAADRSREESVPSLTAKSDGNSNSSLLAADVAPHIDTTHTENGSSDPAVVHDELERWRRTRSARLSLRLHRILRLFRPQVHVDYQRLEWTCSCGKGLFADYVQQESLVRSKLALTLPDCKMSRRRSDFKFQRHVRSDLRTRIRWWLGQLAELILVPGFLLLAWDPENISSMLSNFSKKVVQSRFWQSVLSRGSISQSAVSICIFGFSALTMAAVSFAIVSLVVTPVGTASSSTVVECIDSNDSQGSNTSALTPTRSNEMIQDVAKQVLGTVTTPNWALQQAGEPSFFEICVTRSQTRICLGEIQLTNAQGKRNVKSDVELFAQIRTRYEELRGKGLRRFLYRPSNIHFVRFGVQKGGNQTGIYEWPLAIPPEAEVKEKRWHYYECPLDPLPPIDRRTFFHYFWEHASHPKSTGNVAFDRLFYNRLPKKLGTSMLVQTDPGKLHLGWGIHIIEGPNKPLLAWMVAAILTMSFVLSVIYDVAMKNKDSGFGFGQWMVAVLTAALTAVYFHMADLT